MRPRKKPPTPFGRISESKRIDAPIPGRCRSDFRRAAVAGMSTGRLEGFSDGVLAIVITIMVLELEVPRSTELAALRPLAPVSLSYVLSFVYLGIYWNNHHHLLHATHRVDGRILWANLHLLFWLSLIPFVTAWIGENHFAPVPTAVYGSVLLLAAIAYWILQCQILRRERADSALRIAVRRDWKAKLSPVLYALAIPLALVHPSMAGLLYAAVALLWLTPDSRIEPARSDVPIP